MRVTRKNIKSFLKTRRGFKWYFKFPFLKKHQTLIVETSGLMNYWEEKGKGHAVGDFIRDEVLNAAYKAFKKRNITNKYNLGR